MPSTPPPWRDIPVAYAATGRGHGRITTRTIQVLDAPRDLPFPHVSQPYLIERHATALDGAPRSEAATLGVTSLTADRAAPARLAGTTPPRPPAGQAAISTGPFTILGLTS